MAIACDLQKVMVDGAVGPLERILPFQDGFRWRFNLRFYSCFGSILLASNDSFYERFWCIMLY